MTTPTQPLIYRYTILKGKLQREIPTLDKRRIGVKYLRGLLTDDWPINDKELIRLLVRQIRLHRQSLRLLEDTFNGEDGEIK